LELPLSLDAGVSRLASLSLLFPVGFRCSWLSSRGSARSGSARWLRRVSRRWSRYMDAWDGWLGLRYDSFDYGLLVDRDGGVIGAGSRHVEHRQQHRDKGPERTRVAQGRQALDQFSEAGLLFERIDCGLWVCGRTRVFESGCEPLCPCGGPRREDADGVVCELIEAVWDAAHAPAGRARSTLVSGHLHGSRPANRESGRKDRSTVVADCGYPLHGHRSDHMPTGAGHAT
jgi:hypothetical protein